MNLGENRFAGETVRQSYNIRSWITGSNKNTTRPGHGPPRNPGSPRPGAQRHGPENHKTKEGWSKIEWASLSKRIPVKRSRELPTDLPTEAPKLRSCTQQAAELIKTTTGEKSLSHCHSNRCGHVGHWPSYLHGIWHIIIESPQSKQREVVFEERVMMSRSCLERRPWLMQRQRIPI